MVNQPITEQTIRVWNDRVAINVKQAGSGPPLLYLHAAGGLRWDGFLQNLSRDYRVYAPEFPGTTEGDPYAVRAFDDLWDLVLAYQELVEKLTLENPVVVGPAFGGMLAAELACAFPDLFQQVVLLAPVGLWHADKPVMNWAAVAPEALPALLFSDPDSQLARDFAAPPDDPELAVKQAAARIWAFGCTAKFMWPLPDKGLSKRLHRLRAPTLVLWGEKDRFISPDYTQVFADAVQNCKTQIIAGAGHLIQVEAPDEVARRVREFLVPAG